MPRVARKTPEARLSPRMVPKPLFYKNLRKHLRQHKWQKLVSNPVREAANWQCEVCESQGVDRRGGKVSANGSPVGWDVCCDEDWHYDDETHTATLIGIQCICWKCNLVIHAGIASTLSSPEQLAEIRQHALSVNKMSESEWERVVARAWDDWQRRSKLEWSISWNNWDAILGEKLS